MTLFANMYYDFTTGKRIDSPGAVTLACSGGVLQKCTHAGYRPWANAKMCKGSGKGACSHVALKDYHQACVRMLRADYCGNGQSWTKDGTYIDVYDYLQPPIQLREQDWDIEARWVTGGAMCLNKPRHPELGFPGCADSAGKMTQLPKCQPYEVNRGLIVDAFSPTGTTPKTN
jgi:hypothetical protein